MKEPSDAAAAGHGDKPRRSRNRQGQHGEAYLARWTLVTTDPRRRRFDDQVVQTHEHEERG